MTSKTKTVPRHKTHPVAALLTLRQIKRSNAKKHRLASRHLSSSSRRFVLVSLKQKGFVAYDEHLGLRVTKQGVQLLHDLEKRAPSLVLPAA